MRVTTAMTNKLFIAQIMQQQSNLNLTQRQISTGLRVLNPSDDPGKSGTIAQLKDTLQRLERHKERIAYASNFLAQQESVLDSSNELLVRAKELATQGANETLGVEERQMIADEVWQLRDELVGLANTTIQGRYIYGAADDDDPPFDPAVYTNPPDPDDPAHVRYVFDAEDGTDVTRDVQISDNVAVRMNTPGNEVFSDAISALERLGRALDGYRTTPEDLSGLPDGGGVAFVFPAEFDEQTQDILETIDLIEAARSGRITPERTNVGSRLARIDLTLQLMETAKLDTESARSGLQDIDIVEAASNFSQIQLGLEASLASGAQLNQLSLLNFL